MARRRLTRWQKASAIVPVALLAGAWGATVTGPSVTSASSQDGQADPGVPDVPTTPFQQPASVQRPDTTPTGVDPRAGVPGTLSTLSANGIPAAALLAYRRTETLLNTADPGCRLPWTLVAAIGRVESNHGRYGGNVVGADGVSRPGIVGIPLDGSNGTARISDTDGGALDRDKVYDRAVGPMQFIPGTWNAVAVDSNTDGVKNPQDVNDAALATGVYLCAGDGDLSTRPGASAAVLRYNRSQQYVDLVLAIAARYAAGDFSETPNNLPSTPAVVNRKDDQSLSPADRSGADTVKPAKQKKKRGGGTSGGSGGSGGGTGSGDDSGSGGGGNGSGGGSGGGDSKDPTTPVKKPVKDAVDGAGDAVGDAVDKAPLPPVVKDPVKDVWTRTEATAHCTLTVPTLQVLSCVNNLVGKPQN